MQHPVGMGRGYPSYGGIPTSAAAAGYGGAAPGAAPGYGYGMICLNTVLSSTQAFTFLWKPSKNILPDLLLITVMFLKDY